MKKYPSVPKIFFVFKLKMFKWMKIKQDYMAYYVDNTILEYL